ncbi:MAG: DinB family protein, partial [Gammaproteobacteria bacterium]|nr:DinB family protein [Gammaproteobacteria bacterium]
MPVHEALVIAERLSALHDRLIKQFSSFSEKDLRTQYHPDLSQLGWHLNHIAFIEQYWLREVVLGDDSRTKNHHREYFPEMIERASRGQLEDLTDFNQLRTYFSESEKLWAELSTGKNEHHLLKN